MLVDDCGSGMGWTTASVRGGWSTPGGCRNSAMSFGGSVPSLHPTGSIRSLRSQHSMQVRTGETGGSAFISIRSRGYRANSRVIYASHSVRLFAETAGSNAGKKFGWIERVCLVKYERRYG